MKKRLIFILIILLVLSTGFACNKSEKKEQLEPMVDPISDNNRVFYQIFTGSFSDSNNDGIGDLRGIINRLDYLNDGNINSGKSLGIQGIWLTPIFKSPTYHKYDVEDYYTIDPEFGTMDDLKELIEECHKRNVKIIIDLVLNHTSTRNEWYRKFQRAHQNYEPNDKYYNYYSWCIRSEKPAGRNFSSIYGTSDELYEANFSGDMPELNFDNPEVRNECLNIAKYYLDLGIDGFRFDAAKYVYFTETEKNVEFWDWYMAELRKIKSDVYCVGEVWSNDYETVQYNSSLNCFNFQMSGTTGYIYNAASIGDCNVFTKYVVNYIKQIKEKNSDALFVPFISNHDMDRSSGYLTLASKRMFMAANLYILCYGSPFIYYGEEIGMKGTRGGAQTDANRRLAMLWGDGDTVDDPIGTTYEKSKQTNGTVKSQLEDENSLLNYYAKLIAFRNKFEAICRGDYEAITLPGDTGCFKITYEGKTYFLLHNTQNSSATVSTLRLTDKELNLLGFIGQGECTLVDNEITIANQTSVLLEIK